jgi:hypothetical protein
VRDLLQAILRRREGADRHRHPAWVRP